MTRPRKQGSLSLSVNAIVVLVMAITLLGLGLSFIKDKFQTGDELLGGVEDSVRQNIINDMTNSGDKLTIMKTEYKMDGNADLTTAFGIMNQDEVEKNFVIRLKLKSPLVADEIANLNADIISPGYPDDSVSTTIGFQYIPKYPTVGINQPRVQQLKLITRGATAGNTYFIRMEMCEGEEMDACDENGGEFVYAVKEFFLEII
ncbi:MAG: hypothetical protein ABIC95_05170 [archaeon]